MNIRSKQCALSPLLMAVAVVPAFGQKLKVVSNPNPKSDGFSEYYLIAFVMGIAISGVIFWWLRNRSLGLELYDEPRSGATPTHDRRTRSRLARRAKPGPSIEKVDGANILAQFETVVKKTKEINRKLPIFEITDFEEPAGYEELPESKDPELLLAIDQSDEEVQGDASIREDALAILADSRTRQSVEAISQVALYDLSSHLRTKALAALADFDHVSVFESVLLACADPAREVRTAAAKALFRLSFDRTGAWLRILHSGNSTRILQAARALTAADLAGRAFDRLIHNEPQSAREAFAIVSLLICGGETEPIMEVLQNCEDVRIARAIFHVARIVDDQRFVDELSIFSETFQLSDAIQDELDNFLGSLSQVSDPLKEQDELEFSDHFDNGPSFGSRIERNL